MRSIVLASSIAVLAAAAGCQNTTPPRLYGTMTWKMRCPNPTTLPMDCAMGCSEGMDRLVDGFDDENGNDVRCTVTESTDGTQRIINFRLQNSAGQSVTFQNVAVPFMGGSALSGVVRLREDNEYSGAAGALAPSVTSPCQVQAVRFFRDEMSGDPTIQGEVLCQYMRADADRRLCRGMSTSGGGSAAMTPAQFTIFGCTGLTGL
ncbi:MAG: hypothetical protein OHK0013_37700 [Sandaracinaceae bacterium]